MARSLRIKPVCEVLDYKNKHKDFEIKETRVSDYLRRYGTGHIEDVPQNTAPEVRDDRTVEQMLEEPFVEHLSTEPVDVIMLIDANRERFEKAFKELELTKTQHKRFKDALSVINNPNASHDSKREAYSILEELSDKKMLRKRVRKN